MSDYWVIQEKQRVREAFLQRNDSSSLCFFVSLQYEKNTENKESEVTLPLSKHQVLLDEQEHYLEIIEQMRWKLYELQRRLWSPKSEKLEICPMQVFVRQIIRPKYKTPGGRILIASLPPRLYTCKSGCQLLDYMAVRKYADHQPLHRQIEIFDSQRLVHGSYLFLVYWGGLQGKRG